MRNIYTKPEVEYVDLRAAEAITDIVGGNPDVESDIPAED